MTNPERPLRRGLAQLVAPLTGPLGRRLFVGLVLLSLLPLLVSNAIGYLRSTAIIEDQVERYLDGIADLQGLHVRDQLVRHMRSLRSMAADEAVLNLAELTGTMSDGGPAAQEQHENEYLAGRLVEHPTFEALYVFTARGEILASAPLPPADLELFMGPLLTTVGETLSVVHEDRVPHAPRLRFAVPVGLPNQASPTLFLGGYVEVLGASEFLRIPPHIAGTVETFIVDEDGVPIFISHPHGLVNYAVPLATPLLSHPLGSSMVYPDRQGVEVIGTMVPVPGLPWHLVMEVPVSDALRELRRLRSLSVWLSALLAVVVVGLASVMVREIVAPVRRLVAATRRLAAGDLSARVDVGKSDEIGELGASFNEMASELASTSARAQELHRREIERAGQLATVGELAAGVAHEIKNPIVGISSGLDLLMRHTEDNAKLGPIVDEARRQVSRIGVAVRDLLAFARPSAPNREQADLNAVVERALLLIEPIAKKSRVRVEPILNEVPPVYVDREMMRQSLVNLVVNGIQACESGGRVTIETRSAPGSVKVRISDNGKGIPAEQLDQIFRPFFTTKHQGTGLGLSITRSMLERHGGTISVESVEGQGTTFTLTVPLAPGTVEERAAVESATEQI